MEIKIEKKRDVRSGDWHRINDKRTAGHKSLITRVRGEVVEHLPTTHSPKTRNQKNIKLQQNPQLGKSDPAFVLRKIQKTTKSKVGKKQEDMIIKNAVDKSIVRHLKKKGK